MNDPDIRAVALQAAVTVSAPHDPTIVEILTLADGFADYIRGEQR